MWVIKPFEELTAGELHLIYKERTTVFVVEQNCPYQEVDDTDLVSIHFWKQVDNRLLAYARLIPEESGVRIGRVLVPKRIDASRAGICKNAFLRTPDPCASTSLSAGFLCFFWIPSRIGNLSGR